MHILLVHQYFLGRNDAGGSRWNQFAKYWAAAGHEVTVLAGTVHYAKGVKEPQYKGRFAVREAESPGVTVWRCHVSEAYNRSFLGRLWAYGSFTLSSTLVGLCRVKRPDVIVATSPPLTVAPTLRLLAGRYRVPGVFEVRDLWPESAIDTGVLTSRPLIKASYRMEAMGYRAASLINVLTPAFREALIATKGVEPERLIMIPNGADLDIMRPGPKDNEVRRRLGLTDKYVVSYFGAHGRANRVGQLLDVAARIRDTHPDVRLMLVGDGMEKPDLVADATRRGLDNVVFVDSVPKDRVCDYINASDVCTAVLMRNETFKTVYPNKVFDYMSCRRPIIIGIDGVARQFVADAGAGLYAEPENTDAFVAALDQLRADPAAAERMGAAGLAYVREHYDRRVLAERYLAHLEAVVQEGRRRR
ncbi:MAG: glycosyltransferase family 4 protein [Planctomycetes bacterium]|nr:glycosyltransferase family 4 protein [Planctomycetota bacterium]